MDWSKLPSLASLRAFESAARAGGLTAAAKELNVTHSAIAQHIRQLEAFFNQDLMVREGKAVRPTETGAKLARDLSAGFLGIATSVQDILDQSLDRPLRISATPNFAANWLMPRMGEFWAAHPGIDVEILPSTALVDLRTDNVDIAIRYGKGAWPGLNADLLIDAQHAVVAAPELIAREGYDCFQNLETAHWIFDHGWTEEQIWVTQNGIDLDRTKVTRMASAQLTREAVRAGLGVTATSLPLVEADIANGTLAVVCEGAKAKFAYFLVTRKDVVSANRSAFLKWIKSAVSE